MVTSQHQQEWVASAVIESIITQNVESLDDSKDIAQKLGWKAWKNGAGWFVSGVDPKTGDRRIEGAQFKPDKPQTNRNGKAQKYVSRKGESHPLFLGVDDHNFWSSTLSSKKPIVITEGAKKAGALLSLGVPCISLPGVYCGQKSDRLHSELRQFFDHPDSEGREVFLAFDSDMWSNNRVWDALDQLSRLLANAGAVVRVLDWKNRKCGNDDRAKGVDDWLALLPEGDRSKEIQGAMKLAKTMREMRDIRKGDTEGVERKVRLTIYQEAMRDLYSDNWVVVNGLFYHWNGCYYKHSPEEVERKRIIDYVSTRGVEDEKNDCLTFPHATPKKMEEIFKWCRSALARSADSVNPTGYLNCLNGVLQIGWEPKGGKLLPTWTLIEHSPEIVYLYPPSVRYDPQADETDCDKLLECLDAPQRTIFLRTIAASLDLATVRSVKGRTVKALMMKGNGSNGKDTLREVLSMIYGHQGLTACTFTDFQSYDSGRKFPLNKLQYSRVNWSPENSPYTNLDSLQSLKAAISGDVLDYEGKGKDERSGASNAVFLFNCNEAPNFLGAREAIQSRYAVLSFDKTYSVNPDPRKGELQADSRFKYDTNFLKENVLPAFLNKMLRALVDLMVDGIDYACTVRALEEIQQDKNHLYRFANESGLEYDPESSVYVGDVWNELHSWYVGNGTINVDANGKESWTDQVRPGDKNVKGPNQILTRIIELFPKAKRGNRDVKGVKINGLRFVPLEERNARPIHPEQNEILEPIKPVEPVEPIALIEPVEPTNAATDDVAPPSTTLFSVHQSPSTSTNGNGSTASTNGNGRSDQSPSTSAGTSTNGFVPLPLDAYTEEDGWEVP